jgi:hypothetical protein
LLVSYLSHVFSSEDGQAHPIFGWFPDDSGELKHTDIDRITSKPIQRGRKEWHKPDPSNRQAS